MINKIMKWVIPDSVFWSYRDQIFLFYEKQWITLPFWVRRDYMQIYGIWK